MSVTIEVPCGQLTVSKEAVERDVVIYHDFAPSLMPMLFEHDAVARGPPKAA